MNLTLFLYYIILILLAYIFHHRYWALFIYRNSKLHFIYIIIIMTRHQHGYPWPSLVTPPYRPLLSAGLQGYRGSQAVSRLKSSHQIDTLARKWPYDPLAENSPCIKHPVKEARLWICLSEVVSIIAVLRLSLP